MIQSRHSLTEIAWCADLASLLADCSAAIARLDARISGSFLREAWTARASFAGFAAALRAQHFELEEIDVFCGHFGLKADRKVSTLDADIVSQLPAWMEALSCQAQAIACRNDRHWNENLPFIFDPPSSWDSAPKLLRALEVLAIWSTTQATIECWLAVPDLLHGMNITTIPLPCLAGGDPALRSSPRDRDSNLRRSLKRLTRAAKDGEAILLGLETLANGMITAIGTEMRPKSMKLLATMLLDRPAVTPKEVSIHVDISLSGAGKLLSKAHRYGLVHPQNGLNSWKAYLSADMAMRYGIIRKQPGRPPKGDYKTLDVSDLIARFDAEQHAIEAVILRPLDFQK